MNKPDLIHALQAQLGAWESALSKVDPAVVGTEDVEGYYSVKDLVAHVMANTRWMGAQIKGLVTGTPATPLELYGQEEPPQLESFHFEHVNRSIYEQYRDAPFDSVLSDFRSVWSELIWSTQSASEEVRPGRSLGRTTDSCRSPGNNGTCRRALNEPQSLD